MSPEDLKQALTPDTSRQLAISAASIPDLADLLNELFSGNPIKLKGATLSERSDYEFVVDATADSQFGHDAPPFNGTFSVPPTGGTVSATMQFQVIGEDGTDSAWNFSDAFKGLPASFDFSKSIAEEHTPYLDALSLSGACFYACTGESTAPKYHVSLRPGLNFAASWAPEEIAKVLSIVAQLDSSLIVSGSINLQSTADDHALTALPEGQVPPNTDPGIHLEVRLGEGKILSGSKLSVDAPVYRLYSPLSFDPAQENPRLPSQIIEATVHIPSAGTDITMSAEHLIGLSQICLAIHVEQTARGVGPLTDAFGGGIVDALPLELRDSVSALTELKLDELGLRISYGGSSPSIDFCFAQLDFGDGPLHWDIVPGFFIVNGLSARLMIAYPFDSKQRNVGATVYGNIELAKVPIAITTDIPDFFISAQIENQSIPIGTVMSDLHFHVPPPDDLSIDEVVFNAKPHEYYSITARMATDPPWKIPIGKGGILIEDVVAALSRDVESAQNSGSFSGTIAFNPENDLSVSYDIDEGLRILGSFGSIDLVQLIQRLVDDSLPLPKSFKIVLDDAILLIEKDSDTFKLMVGTKVVGIGIFAFEVLNDGGPWGYAAGMELDLSDIDKIGLGVLTHLADMFPLDTLVLIVSTIHSSDFEFPDMDKFGDPDIKGQVVIPPQASGLQKGLSIYANTTLGKHEPTRQLARLLHLSDSSTIGVTMTIGEQPELNSSVFFSVTDIVINKKTRIDTGNLGARISGGDPAFFLEAVLHTEIQQQSVEFDTGLVVAAEGFYVYAQMTAEQLLKAGTIHFGPVQIANLLFVLGVGSDGVPIIGVGATIAVHDFESSLTIFFDGGNPAESMFAGAVSPLTAKQVLDAFVGGHDTVPNDVAGVLGSIGLAGIDLFSLDSSLAKPLNEMNFAAVRTAFANAKRPLSPDDKNLLLIVGTKSKTWFLSDMRDSGPVYYQIENSGKGKLTAMLQPQAYCVLAPGGVNVAGNHYPQAIKVAGKLNFLILHATVDIEAVVSKGIYFDAYVDPITIYKDWFFSLTADTASDPNAAGPEFSLSTFHRDDVPKPKRDPHVFVTGKFNFLGLSAGTSLSVTTSTLNFHFDQTVQKIVGVNLSADIANNGDFKGGGSAYAKIKADIPIPWYGTVHFHASVAAALQVSFLNAKAGAKARLKFEFWGWECDTGWVGVSINTEPFANFVQTFINIIIEYFKHLFGTNLEPWLLFVHKGAIIDHEKISVVMRQQLDDDWKTGVLLLKNAGYGEDETIGYISDGWSEIDKSDIEKYVHGKYAG